MPTLLTTLPQRRMTGLQASATLQIENLCVSIKDHEILKGVSLEVKSGEIHVIMGPNGSGKSTLLNAIMGHPRVTVNEGVIRFNGVSVLALEPHQRAHLGLFLAFQHPLEIPGVTFGNFMRLSKNAQLKAQDTNIKEFSPTDFIGVMKKNVELLEMDHSFIGRALNEGFSGGEKKRAEVVQMAILEPKIALLDEIDSGLDIDALKSVSTAVTELFRKNKPGILIVTHYQRILNLITPHFVHVMSRGRIVKSGGKELALELEEKGFKQYVDDI